MTKDDIALKEKLEEITDAKVGKEEKGDETESTSVLGDARKLKAELLQLSKELGKERDLMAAERLKQQEHAAELELSGRAIAGQRDKSKEELDKEEAMKTVDRFFPPRR